MPREAAREGAVTVTCSFVVILGSPDELERALSRVRARAWAVAERPAAPAHAAATVEPAEHLVPAAGTTGPSPTTRCEAP